MRIKLEILPLSDTELLIKLVSLEDVDKHLSESDSKINGYSIYFRKNLSSFIVGFQHESVHFSPGIKTPKYKLLGFDSKKDRIRYHQFLLELQRKYS